MKKLYHFHRTRYPFISSGLHWAHATKNGGAVLKTEVSWRNINGIIISTSTFCLWIHFRRLSRW